VLPTLLEAVGMAVPATVQGRSFLPLLRGDRFAPRDAIYAEKTFHSYYDPMRAVRTERHKHIRNFETTFLVEVPGDVQLGAVYRTELQRYVAATHPELDDRDRRPAAARSRAVAVVPALPRLAVTLTNANHVERYVD